MASGSTPHPRAGQVHKIIRVVATSAESWEDAARAGVAEAVKTIHDLTSATLIKADLVTRDGKVDRYRVKLEMAFQLDRSRAAEDGNEVVDVRRYLVVANQTLPSPGLAELITEKASIGPSEFHVLVPEGPLPVVAHDPIDGLAPNVAPIDEGARLRALAEADERLDAFRRRFAQLGSRLSGEVGLGDPMTAVHRVMARSSFDEIIVSTLPVGISRWVGMDLPSRLERSFDLPVIHLVQGDS
jgi:flavin-binding protein dodecin